MWTRPPERAPRLALTAAPSVSAHPSPALPHEHWLSSRKRWPYVCSFQSYGQAPLTSPCLSFLVSAIGAASPDLSGFVGGTHVAGGGAALGPRETKTRTGP